MSPVDEDGLDPASDASIVVRVLAGDRTAFNVLYTRHQALIARRLRRVLGNPADVEEAVQTTFLHAYRRLRDFDRARSFPAWLQGIAFRTAANQLRARQRRRWLVLDPGPRIAADAAPGQVSAESSAFSNELAALLYEILESVPPKNRIAFTLHELEGLGFTEIGKLVGASPQTVRARVLAARQSVQKHAAKLAGDHVPGSDLPLEEVP